MKQIVIDIIADLENRPERWEFAYCTWRRDDGVEVWRANMPILDIGLYSPVKIRFSLVEKFRLWRAFRRWSTKRTLEFVASRGAQS